MTPPPPRTQVAARDRALGVAGATALTVTVLLLLGVGSASVLLALRNARSLEVASQTERALAGISDVMTSVQDAETSQRGYLLTGRDSYLNPYRSAVERMPRQLARLSADLPTVSEQRHLVADLNTVIAAKFAELKETLDLAEAGDRFAAIAIVQSDRGQRAMIEVRRLTARIAAEQRGIYETQIGGVNAGGRELVIIDATGLVLVLLLAAGVGLGVRRNLAMLRQARTELTMANALLAGANARLAGANSELEARVLKRTADLTEANEEIQRFAYIVSHDLRAPLVNIMGFTGELEDATSRLAGFLADITARRPEEVSPDVRLAATEDLPEAIRFIKASSSKMDRLIAAILRLSRAGQRVLAPERVEMAPFLRGILDSLRHQTGQREAEIVVGDTPDIVADRLVLEQIFSNLIENALKYLKPGRPGVIRVDGHLAGDLVVYEISDNGRGIAAQDNERVFELFRRAGTQDVQGEGIGLAHVRALVRRLGGKIDCESALDVGSTFRVRLPPSPSAPAPAGRHEGPEG